MHRQRGAQSSSAPDLVTSHLVPQSDFSLILRIAALSERWNSPALRLNIPHPTARTPCRTCTTTTESRAVLQSPPSASGTARRRFSCLPASVSAVSAARLLRQQIENLPAQRAYRQNGRPPLCAQSRSLRRCTRAQRVEATLGVIRSRLQNDWRRGRGSRPAVAGCKAAETDHGRATWSVDSVYASCQREDSAYARSPRRDRDLCTAERQTAGLRSAWKGCRRGRYRQPL